VLVYVVVGDLQKRLVEVWVLKVSKVLIEEG
jgi:hypothetical protein